MQRRWVGNGGRTRTWPRSRSTWGKWHCWPFGACLPPRLPQLDMTYSARQQCWTLPGAGEGVRQGSLLLQRMALPYWSSPIVHGPVELFFIAVPARTTEGRGKQRWTRRVACTAKACTLAAPDDSQAACKSRGHTLYSQVRLCCFLSVVEL